MRSVFALATIVATVTAQAQNLTAALAGQPELTTLLSVLGKYPDLVTGLSAAKDITVVAPSNAAFAKFTNTTSANTTLANDALVKAILSYHILNGTIKSTAITTTPAFVPTKLVSPLLANVTGGQRVEALKTNDSVQIISGLMAASNVVKADIAFDNGVIHIIDSILTPPASISNTATQFKLSSVVGALAKADLVKTVDETKDLTVFVPSNDAFAAIASIAANASVETIATVLKYHVIAGSVLYSTDLKNTTVKTLGGGSITVTVANGSVFVNQAKVIIPNVLVANGVVHVIDSVLNPGNTTVAPGTNGTVFPGASSASDVPFTSGVPSATLSGSDVPTAVASPSASIKPSSAGAPGAAYAMATGIVGAGVVFAGALMAL